MDFLTSSHLQILVRIRIRIRIHQRYGSEDLDPYQNVADPEHCFLRLLTSPVENLRPGSLYV